MTLNDIKSHYGTFVAAARASGFSQSSFSNWATRGAIPLQAQLKFELVSRGALRAKSRTLSMIVKRRTQA